MSQNNTAKPSVLLLGGRENALAIVRSLSKKGITVNVSASASAHAFRSRYCNEKFPVLETMSQKEYWTELLFGNKHTHIKGSVIFACNDEAIQFLAENRSSLEEDYILDDYDPEIHKALLDKQETLKLARSVGIATPNFWDISSINDVMKIEGDVIFPAIIKPIHSHLFQRQFNGKKYLRAESFEELVSNAALVMDKDLEFMISELIPGPDTLLSSYYTYHDKDGKPLYHYTKKVIRRFPLNSGAGCYHHSEWLPETAEQGMKFFQGINFRGNGNVEFKKDLRDGQYKIIESNTRFTGGHPLLVSSGADIAYAIYNHLVGEPVPEIGNYKQLGYWYPMPDFAAFRELQGKGLLSLTSWIKSLFRKQTFPFFKWDDPVPSLYEWKNVIEMKLKKKKLADPQPSISSLNK